MKKILIPLLFALFGSGCASFGPTILIETEQPEQDFLVLCEWHKNALIDFHGGGRKQSDWKAYVTESGKEVDCGVSIWGGHASATVMHPLYKSAHACYEGCDPNPIKIEDDIIKVKPKLRLVLLREYMKIYDNKQIESRIRDFLGAGLYYKYYLQETSTSLQSLRDRYDRRIEIIWEELTVLKKELNKDTNIISSDDYIEYYWNKYYVHN